MWGATGFQALRAVCIGLVMLIPSVTWAEETAALAPGPEIPKGMVAAFRLPECPRGWTAYALAQGRTIIGVGEGAGLTRRTLEETGGAETHTLTVSEIPAHNHVANPYIYALRVTGSYTAKSIDNTPGEPNLASKGEIRSAGGEQPHNIMQPFVALLYCEKN
jgi:hypothetical protein